MAKVNFASVSDLHRVRLNVANVANVAAVPFDCVRGARGEELTRTTTAIFRARLARVVRVEVAGIEGAR